MSPCDIVVGKTYEGRAFASKKRGPRRVVVLDMGPYERRFVAYVEPQVDLVSQKTCLLRSFAKWARREYRGIEFHD